MHVKPYRSVLYMPSSNTRVLEKAKALDADALVFDLEDAVAPTMKEDARQQAVSAMMERKAYGHRQCVVRINAWDSAWALDDVSAFSPFYLPDAFLLPKVSSPDVILDVARFLDTLKVPQTVRIWAMIETPQALLALESIARLSNIQESRLDALVIGTNDLAKETGMCLAGNREPLLPWLSVAVMTAKAYNLVILDGVYNQFNDLDGYKKECDQGRRYGFDGKTLIHPSQLELANQIFAPSSDEIGNAEKIVAVFALPENSDKNVVAVEGQMVERLHLESAKRILALANAIQKKS